MHWMVHNGPRLLHNSHKPNGMCCCLCKPRSRRAPRVACAPTRAYMDQSCSSWMRILVDDDANMRTCLGPTAPCKLHDSVSEGEASPSVQYGAQTQHRSQLPCAPQRAAQSSRVGPTRACTTADLLLNPGSRTAPASWLVDHAAATAAAWLEGRLPAALTRPRPAAACPSSKSQVL